MTLFYELLDSSGNVPTKEKKEKMPSFGKEVE